MLDVTRLRVLVAVARYGSVTGAARALNYAQPSVSHHLARLESETGTKLIQRAGRGIRLTDAGRLLAERAAEVIGRLDAAENELAAYTGLRAGRLRLAAFPSALGTIVPTAAAYLRGANAALDLRLTEAEPPEALRMLRAGYVDVALVFRYSSAAGVAAGSGGGSSGSAARGSVAGGAASGGSVAGGAGTGADGTGTGAGGTGTGAGGGVAGGTAAGGSVAVGLAAGEELAGTEVTDDGGIDLSEGLRERLLLDEPVYLITAATAATEPTPDLTEFARHRWIAGCDRCRAYLVAQCSQVGFTPKIAFTTDDFVAVQALVAAELGVSTLAGLCLRAARHPGVVSTPLPGTRRFVYAVRYGDPPDPPVVTELMDALSVAAGSAA